MVISTVVSQEGEKVAELEEQVKNFQGETNWAMEEFKAEMQQSATNSRTVILDDLQSLLAGILSDMSKSVNTGEGETCWIWWQRNSACSKGVSLFSSSSMELDEIQRILPKIELVTFEGKEPWAWLRKYEMYFEIDKIPKEQRMKLLAFY